MKKEERDRELEYFSFLVGRERGGMMVSWWKYSSSAQLGLPSTGDVSNS